MSRGTANRQLALATIAFAVAFAVWGLPSGLVPILKARYGLGGAEAGLVVAVPVLLGSIGRVPAGMLADRFGGRLAFSALLVLVAAPCFALALDHDYDALLLWGFWLGLAGTSFAIGVGFVSKWFPPQRQGTALGIYGAGNIGQSVAVFSAPLLAQHVGIDATFALFGLLSLSCGLVFAGSARDAAAPLRAEPVGTAIRALAMEPAVWTLSLFYFLTFGGFVALGVYLPVLLREMFLLTPADAGARTAGFVVLATLARPAGGWLADRASGERLLAWIFWGVAVLAWLMAIESIYTFTVGALGCAVLLGLGNGAVFKVVAQRFPVRTGAATGVVGAAGGLGGFFPPIVLGIFKDTVNSYAPGFALLSAFALGCNVVLARTAVQRGPSGPGLYSRRVLRG